jgi:hypothetical protein
MECHASLTLMQSAKVYRTVLLSAILPSVTLMKNILLNVNFLNTILLNSILPSVNLSHSAECHFAVCQ